MLVKINKQIHQLKQDIEIEEFTQWLNQNINLSKEYISKISINGEEYFTDFEDALANHFGQIEDLVITTESVSLLLNESTLALKDYLESALPQLEGLSSQFYQGASDKAWMQVGELLEALDWIIQYLNNSSVDYPIYKKSKELKYAFDSVNVQLPTLLEAMEQKDTTLMGDLLQYEWHTIFSTLLDTVNQIISEEGVFNVSK